MWKPCRACGVSPSQGIPLEHSHPGPPSLPTLQTITLGAMWSHMTGSQNLTFPTLLRGAPTQPGHEEHAPARRFLSMLFLPLVPQTKKNQDSHFGMKCWNSLGTCGRSGSEESLPYSSLVWSYPIYPQGRIGCLGLTPPLPPKATNSCYSTEWQCEVIS